MSSVSLLEVVMETKLCVVCGMGSTRKDWQDLQYPACDSHSKEVVDAAIAKLTPATPKTKSAS